MSGKKVTRSCVSDHISNICELFNIKNEQGYTQRDELIILTEIFSNTNKFLEWFCWNISQQLKLESNIDEYLQARARAWLGEI
ncbi:MAG: hypothetical protein HC789_01115 [Microcoleus sp. CSU_2_2]|nr:hypothetical protein [Microcoleus sp. SU_5_3]NJS09062.1 hypothetical protein [Microcoleus sp. CSU_2_2]